MEVLLALPPETPLHPGHREPTTVADELETNPFVRVWRGLDPEAPSRAGCGRGGDARPLGPDYDGTHKAWVRYADGRDAIVGGSRRSRLRRGGPRGTRRLPRLPHVVPDRRRGRRRPRPARRFARRARLDPQLLRAARAAGRETAAPSSYDQIGCGNSDRPRHRLERAGSPTSSRRCATQLGLERIHSARRGAGSSPSSTRSAATEASRASS